MNAILSLCIIYTYMYYIYLLYLYRSICWFLQQNGNVCFKREREGAWGRERREKRRGVDGDETQDEMNVIQKCFGVGKLRSGPLSQLDIFPMSMIAKPHLHEYLLIHNEAICSLRFYRSDWIGAGEGVAVVMPRALGCAAPAVFAGCVRYAWACVSTHEHALATTCARAVTTSTFWLVQTLFYILSRTNKTLCNSPPNTLNTVHKKTL